MFSDDRIDALVQQHLQLHAEYLALKHVAVFAAILLFVISGCSSDSCNKGTCKFNGAMSACVTEEAYDELMDEFRYMRETGQVSRALDRLYQQGQCVRFPEGTKVHVLETGMFIVKIRFIYQNSYPDMWISPEMLDVA